MNKRLNTDILSLQHQSSLLVGQRLSACRRYLCQTTGFCRRLNTRSQSDGQQFWKQDLCCRRTTSLEQSAAQSKTMWAVIWPVQAVTKDILIRTVRPRQSLNCIWIVKRLLLITKTFFLVHLRRNNPNQW